MNKNGNKMTQISVAMIGGRRSYLVPQILSEIGLLDKFFTDTYIGNKFFLKHALKFASKLLKNSNILKLLGRDNSFIDNRNVVSFDFFGYWYSSSIKKSASIDDLELIYLNGAKIFVKKIIKYKPEKTSAMWCFSGASLELMQWCQNNKIKCILDQVSYPNKLENKLVIEEYKISKEWINNPEPPILKSLGERETNEWALACRIIAGSEFVKSGLMECGVSSDKISVISSGVNLNKFKLIKKPHFTKQRKLRILFVGRVSVLKGAHYILKAMSYIDNNLIDIRMVGAISLSKSSVNKFKNKINFTGHVPKVSLYEHYEWADIFCFPSITEGSAEVVYEALASGLPTITTYNSGSLVRDSVDGFIVPIRDEFSIAEKINIYLNNPKILEEHKNNVIKDRHRVDISSYKEKISAVVMTSEIQNPR